MSIQNLNFEVALLTIFTGAAVTIMGMYWYQKKYNNAIPKIWKPIGKVKNIYIYPLKSGRRVELETAECTYYGLKMISKSTPQVRDRCLVVYKEGNHEFKTGRNYPKLLLVETSATDENHFTMTAPDMEPLRVKIPKLEKGGNSLEVKLWFDENVFSLDCGDEAAKWFSRYLLGKPSGLRLGFHDGKHRRYIDKYHKDYAEAYPKMKNATGGMYNDIASIMLLSQATVDDLAKRVSDSKVTVHNFRPNIVIDGDDFKPYAEDSFDWIKIGDVVMRNVKPCTRCTMINVNSETATRSTDNEPYKTLTTYRKQRDLFQIDFDGDYPVVGICTGFSKFGNISAGDVVYVGN